jgi:hypothetical protein
MIKLTNILKEILLNECFYTKQWEAFYKRFPEYIQLIKNDPIVKEKGWGIGNEYTSNDPDNKIYQDMGMMGGTQCGLGPEDFTYDGLVKFFDRMVSLEKLTVNTKNKILVLAKKYFDNYQKDVDESNRQAEIRWFYQDYLVNRRNKGEEKALNMLKRDLESSRQGRYVTSPFVSQYNITLDDVLNYSEDDLYFNT